MKKRNITMRLTVDAVWAEKMTDAAYTHQVQIRTVQKEQENMGTAE